RIQQARERLTEIVKMETLAVDPEAMVGARSTGVIVLCATGHAAAANRKGAALRLANRIVKRVAEVIHDMTVTVGVGRDFSSFDQVAESFRQAELAAQLGTVQWNGNRAIHYDDLGVHRILFAMCDHEEMITPALQRLLEYDKRHKSNYVGT